MNAKIWARTCATVICATALLTNCNDVTPSNEDPSTLQPSATAVSLHEALHAYAMQKDINAFQALLTPDSVQLLNDYFDATSLANRNNTRAVGWSDFLEEHALVSSDTFRKAPYPVVGEGESARLAIDKHPNSQFFRDIVRLAAVAKPSGSGVL